MADLAARLASLSPEKRALLDRRLQSAPVVKPKISEPIAVIGMACRFPGADSPESFWKLLAAGGDAITEVPAVRWNVNQWYNPESAASGAVMTRSGGFLKDIDRFDAAFFGISPREAARMDPQQRLLLEVAWDALEDAGQDVHRLESAATGVFVGLHSHSSDYFWFDVADPSRMDPFTGAGTSHSIATGRLSYLFNFHGPSLVVDTACSSSLVAVHLACQSLRARECSVALAGGVNAILSPLWSVALSRLGMLAPDGRCKTFDASADGFGRSEGCGIVVLRRLSDAVADNDPIVAVIRGSAVNQDGRTNGITAPNGLSQRSVVKLALQNAGIEASQIGYVETHGTGTTLGDPIEVEALADVLGNRRPDALPCFLGAAKSSIGHAEGAAGVAGLIKAALSLRHRSVPPVAGFKRLNPHIALEGTRLEIPTEMRVWESPKGEPRCAGVSSFGWSGTNAHVIVEEHRAAAGPTSDATASPASFILPISAKSETALASLAAGYRDWLAAEGDSDPSLQDISYTASVRRTHHDHRLAIVGSSRAELAGNLDAFLRGEERWGVLHGRKLPGSTAPLVFVFGGQGSQWPGMAAELITHEPVFREAIDRCAAIFDGLGRWSLRDSVTSVESGGRLNETEIAQPSIFAVQIALAELWRSWGIQPGAVVGHSVGEFAAAHVAGILTLEAAAKAVYERGRLMQGATGHGRMLAADLSLEEARAFAEGFPRVEVAAVNAPHSVVLAGDVEPMAAVVTALEKQGTACRLLPVDYAFHTSQMERFAAALHAHLEGLEPAEGTIPFISTVTGCLCPGPQLDAAYWARNVRQPVMFAAATEWLYSRGHRAFLEISPRPVLTSAIARTLRGREPRASIVPSLDSSRSVHNSMLAALGGVYAAGHMTDWRHVYPTGGRCVSLPRYAWQRERYWLEHADANALGSPGRGRVDSRRADAGMSGRRLYSPAIDGAVTEYEVSRNTVWLRDRIDATGCVPHSELLSLVTTAATDAFGDRWEPHSEVLGTPLTLRPDEHRVVQLILKTPDRDDASFAVVSADTETPQLWTTHVEGRLGKHAQQDLQDVRDWMYSVRWIPTSSTVTSDTSPTTGRWLVFSDSGVGAELERLLAARGNEVLVAVPGAEWSANGNVRTVDPGSPEHFERLCSEMHASANPWTGIVHLWSLQSAAGTEPADRFITMCGSLLHLLQAGLSSRRGSLPPVNIVTRGGQAAGSVSERIDADQSTVWGVARVAAIEHPEISWHSIDLDPSTESAASARVLLGEIEARKAGREEVAFREDVRLTPRLARYQSLNPTLPITLHANATYVITGGLGALGLRTARWMAGAGARHLMLIGRREPRRHASEVIDRLERAGVNVRVAQMDVADAGQVQAALAEIETAMPPLRGVVHAAGVLEDGILARQRWPQFEAVMRSKIAGALNLHEHTQHLPLDFFVLFSSAASLLGSGGQASYAAANAYLDAFAHVRAAQGLPAVSINWGTWGAAGMAAALGDGDRQRLADSGLRLIDDESGVRALEHAMAAGHPQVAVLPMDWPRYRAHREGQPPSLFRDVVEESEPRLANSETRPLTLQEELKNTAPRKRHAALLRHIRQHVVAVLGLPPSAPLDAEQGLRDIGFDSLLSLELRNVLQRAVGCTLPATLAFDFPTMEAIAGHVTDVLGLQMLPMKNSEGEEIVIDASDAIEALSEAEAEALLADELNRLHPAGRAVSE